ncbi:MAG: hypothetical protein ACPGVK_03350 [Halocynthiibacter sp.]
MSDADSFIEEVTEEVRRDRLFALMKKYGWIAVLAVLLIVGGAAYNEYRKAKVAGVAQAFGDAIEAALNADDAAGQLAALEAVSATGAQKGLVLQLKADAALKAGKPDVAATALQALADDAEQPKALRDLAQFKFLLLGHDMDVAARRAGFEVVAQSGSTYRLLAEEQVALIDIQAGKMDDGLALLKEIMADADVAPAQRDRISQLIVALGKK